MMRALAVMGLLLAAPAMAADGDLAAGPGQDVVAANCGACHTTDYIKMNSRFLAPETWKAEVTKMRVAFGAPIDDAVAAEITQYLIAQYGAKP